ncbi:MAG: type II secretion system F family protein, partial [bacterium]
MTDSSSTVAFKKKPNIKRQITISLSPQIQNKHRKHIKKQKKKLSLFNQEKKARFKKKIKLEEIYVFANQFSTLLDAGVPLIASLSILAQQTENKDFKIIIDEIIRNVNGGSTLTQAISKYPNIFSNLFVAMVRAAEKGGN